MRIRCHAAALSGISRLGGLRSAPLPSLSALLAVGKEGKGPGFSPPSLFPGTLAFNGSCSSTANLFSGFGGGRGRERGVLCCLNNNKKTHIQLQTAKNLINKWPWGLGPKESSPFHLAPAGPINPLSHFVSRVQRAPRLRLRTVPVALAWGRECATTKAHQKTKREEEWQRGTREPRCQSIASTAKWGHFKHKKGEGLAHGSMTHEEACKVHFQQESSKLTQPWQRHTILPHLECTVSSSSFSKHLSELFLQVKLHRSKEKSGNRTRRSIQTPHLIKHPIHNRLH